MGNPFERDSEARHRTDPASSHRRTSRSTGSSSAGRSGPSACSYWLYMALSVCSSVISRFPRCAITSLISSPQTQWLPSLNKVGIAAVLVGTVEVALIAMVGELSRWP